MSLHGGGLGDPGRGGDNDGFFASTVGTPQQEAASLIEEAIDESRTLQEQTTETVRGDLDPFAAEGVSAVTGLSDLISDPDVQKDFITNNPFFKFLADDAQRRIFSNAAAKGKLGSGGTAEALQNSILLLGSDLVNKNITQRQNLSQLGLGAATNQANLTQIGTSNITDLITSGASTLATGKLQTESDRSQRKSDQFGDVVSLGLGIIGLSDRRFKDNIHSTGNEFYFFKYKGSNKLEFGVMADEQPQAVVNFGGKLYVDYARV